MLQLSPQSKERIRKFKGSRRAYWSLILLLFFFLLSLPAELLFNDKPYVLSYRGQLYFPIFKQYTREDFGEGSAIPIRDYRVFLKQLQAGREAVKGARGSASTSQLDKAIYELYGDDREQVNIRQLARRQDAGEEIYQMPAPKRAAGRSNDSGTLIRELYGDDKEEIDIADLARRQELGQDVLDPGDDAAAVRPPASELDRLLYHLYGDDREEVDIEALARRQEAGEPVYLQFDETLPSTTSVEAAADEIWALWPPIRYNYQTENTLHTTERANLINPLPHVSEETGDRVPGAIRDGHFLGTDEQGRDVLARLIYGFRVSLLFGIGLALTGTVIGCFLGGLQGYLGGSIDLLGQRATEIWGSMPRLFLLIILSSFLASRAAQLSDFQHFALLFGILNLTAWMGMATHMRAQFLRARNLDYVKAARALGQSNFKIMARHILPNSLVPVVTFVPFAVTAGITSLVSLDFLGFGVKYPAPSLGNMLAQGHSTLKWWILVPTFVIFSITLILLTFVGEGVRNAFDPRHKG